jgi:tetratricopeptide (TPR) repeat protein
MHHSRSFLRATFLLGALAALALASPVEAQDRPQGRQDEDDEMARTLFQTARAYFERAQYEEAAAAFGKAYRLSGRHQLLINQARAFEAGGQVREAIGALERFEEVAPEEDPLRGTVTAMLRRLRAAAERGKGTDDAAGDDIDGEEEGTAPAGPAELDPGAPPPAGGRAGMRWSGVGALSLAGLSAAVAIGTGIASRRTHNSLEADCPGGLCPPDLQGDIDRGRRLGVVSTVFTFVGIGAAVTGALLLFLGRDRSESEEPSPRVRPTGGPGMAGAGLHVSF